MLFILKFGKFNNEGLLIFRGLILSFEGGGFRVEGSFLLYL